MLVGTRKDKVPAAKFERIHIILKKLLSTLDKVRAGLNIKWYRTDCLFFPVNNTKSGDRKRSALVASVCLFYLVAEMIDSGEVRPSLTAQWRVCCVRHRQCIRRLVRMCRN